MSVLRCAATLLVTLLAATPSAAQESAEPQPIAAESESDSESGAGPSASALPGLLHAGAPLGPKELTLRATAGYGLTGSRTLVPSAVHRLQGGLAAAVTPLPWLGVGLRLDGRLELHGDDGRGSHVSGFGDPRLYARAGYALDPDWSLGAELSAWVPGRDAPSFVARAISLDARALAAYQPRGQRFGLIANVGARLDNSGEVAPDRSRTRASDIETLGISDSNAILAALGGWYRIQPDVQLFGELSGDVLVGKKAPTFSQSPLRVAGGARWEIIDRLHAEATAIVSLSTRPPLRPEAAWVPIEPRVLVLLGLSYSWSLINEAPPPEVKPAPPPKVVEEKPVPKLARLQGQIVDDHGQAVPDVKVTLVAADGTTLEAITDGDGNYRFEKVPFGTTQLEAHAVGFTTQRWQTEVNQAQIKAETPLALMQAVDVGVLRGLIRSFDSTPLKAKVSVNDARGKTVQTGNSGEDGRFEMELPPGQYKVSVEAPGFKKHTQTMRIKGNGVSVLNADMRAQ